MLCLCAENNTFRETYRDWWEQGYAPRIDLIHQAVGYDNEALSLVGTDQRSSLDSELSNNAMCTLAPDTLAGNTHTL